VTSTGFTLAIESSTYLASCALFAADDPEPVAAAEVPTRGAGGEQLLPAIDAMLRGRGIAFATLERVLCGAGPGSFTSLRVGASIAKGLAHATGASLIAMPSLVLLVQSGTAPRPAGAYLAVVDAMRGERFVQGVRAGSDGRLTMLSPPARIAADAVRAEAARLSATTIGPGEGVDIRHGPHARGALRLPQELLAEVDLASWEPAYGRLAEAQVKWEAAHGRPLGAS
jgi:tRNA threonylcarbamoyladenosine biosynthesis protein TsaB